MLTVILFSHVVIFQAPIMNPDSAGTHFILHICMNAMIFFFYFENVLLCAFINNQKTIKTKFQS